MTHQERQAIIDKLISGNKIVIKSPRIKSYIENGLKDMKAKSDVQNLTPNKNSSTLKKVNELLQMDTKGLTPEEAVKKQREKASEILINSPAIVDRKNIVALYEVVRGDQELFKHIITQRLQKNIDILRESKGKAIGLEEKHRLRTNMELIKIASEMDRFDPTIVYIDKDIIEGEVHKNPKSITECMTEMAEIYANIGNYDQVSVIDDASQDNVGKEVVDAIVEKDGLTSDTTKTIEGVNDNLDNYAQVDEIEGALQESQQVNEVKQDIIEQLDVLPAYEAEQVESQVEHPIEMINDVLEVVAVASIGAEIGEALVKEFNPDDESGV